MIKIKNLSEGQEDFILLQIIRKDFPEINILVDGGRKCSANDKIIECDINKLDYAILTHIDNDHINGMLNIFNKQQQIYSDTVIVYNLFINGMISYKQAEKFEQLIENREIIVSYKEYQENKGDIVFLSVSQRQKLIKQKDKVYITFLAPTQENVKKLYNAYQYWKKNNRKISKDAEIVNRSSIMFLLEVNDKTIFMLGDGYISDIIPSVEILVNQKETYNIINNVDLIKIPHHGSKENNIMLDILIEKTGCGQFILTNDEKGNVKIEDDIKKNLQGKRIYCSKECGKHDEWNVIVNDTIEIGE